MVSRFLSVYQPGDGHHRNVAIQKGNGLGANWQPILNVFGRKSMHGQAVDSGDERDDRGSIQSLGSEPMQEDERAELVSRGYVLPPPRNKANTNDLTDQLEQLGRAGSSAPLSKAATATKLANPYQAHPTPSQMVFQAYGNSSSVASSFHDHEGPAGQIGGTQLVSPEMELLASKPAALAVAATPPVHNNLDHAHTQMRAVRAAVALGKHGPCHHDAPSAWPTAKAPSAWPAAHVAHAIHRFSASTADTSRAGAAAPAAMAPGPRRSHALGRGSDASLLVSDRAHALHPAAARAWPAAVAQEESSHADTRATEHIEQTPEGEAGFLDFNSDGDLADLKGGVRGGMVNYKLWLAAAVCDAGKVRKAIADGGDLGFELQDTDPRALNYKLRKVSCKPLHVAAAFRGKDDDGHASKVVVEILLQAKADVNDFASINTGTTKRQLQAIHIAAGTGNYLTVDLLIEYGASPNAFALMDGQSHYCPIHDAAWFNRSHVVKLLLQRKARVDAINKDGETALHLAAKLGYVEMAEILLQDRFQGRRLQRSNTRSVLKESQVLVDKQDKRGLRPLDLAVSQGQFPPRYLSLFTDCLTHKKKVDAFIKVAHACPSAAPALLRRQGDNSEFHDMSMERISEEWEVTLQYGAKHKVISVNTLATLVEHAPQAAIDLLDALTVTPHVVNREANPLPIRANILKGSEACRIAVAYEDDEDWFWDAVQNVGRSWHKELAPPDPKGGREVEVKVLKLEGLISAQLMHCIAEVNNTTIFTKLVLHGMLKYVWSRIHIVFLFEVMHEVLTAVIVLFWVVFYVGDAPPWLRRWLWSLVASQGIVELIQSVWGSVCCATLLGKARLVAHARRNATNFVSAVLTIGLAHRVAVCGNSRFFLVKSHEFWCMVATDINGVAPVNRELLLAVTVLVKWLIVLYKSRAFAWTGKKIVPIFNAMRGIVGLVIVVVFCMVGFTMAFWSLDRGRINYQTLMDVFTLLVTGENQLGPILKKSDAFPEVALSVGAVVFFSIIILNVFIAVLGDSYFRSREEMVSGYLRERASICTNCLLRPKLRVRAMERLSETWLMAAFVSTVLFLFTVQLLIFLMIDLLRVQDSFVAPSWVFACAFAVVEVYLQAVAVGNRTIGWHTKKLWICHERYISEDHFLAPDKREEISQHNRIMTIKQYMHDQCRTITVHTKSIWGALGHMGQSIHYIEERACDAAQRLLDTEQKLEAIAKVVGVHAFPTGSPASALGSAADSGSLRLGDSFAPSALQEPAEAVRSGAVPKQTQQPQHLQQHGSPMSPQKLGPATGRPGIERASGSMLSAGSLDSITSQEEFPEVKEQQKKEKANVKLFRLGQGLPTLYESSSSDDSADVDTNPNHAQGVSPASSLKGSARPPRTPNKLRPRFKLAADAAMAVRRSPTAPAIPSRSDPALTANVAELQTMVKRMEKQLEAHADGQRRLELSQKRMERNVANIAETLQMLMDTAKKRGKNDHAASPSPERNNHRPSRKDRGEGSSGGHGSPSLTKAP